MALSLTQPTPFVLEILTDWKTDKTKAIYQGFYLYSGEYKDPQ